MHEGVLYAPLSAPQHPGLSEKRQWQQQQHLEQQMLAPGTESLTSGSTAGWGSESGTTASLSGAYGDTHARTVIASAIPEMQETSKVQRESKSKSLAGYDDLFEPPPPQYQYGEHATRR